MIGTEPPFVDERLFIACPIWRASAAVHFSSSELEWPLLPSAAWSEEVLSTLLNAEVRVLLPISRRGDALSESEVYELLTREPGEPSERLESAPSANRD